MGRLRCELKRRRSARGRGMRIAEAIIEEKRSRGKFWQGGNAAMRINQITRDMLKYQADQTGWDRSVKCQSLVSSGSQH